MRAKLVAALLLAACSGMAEARPTYTTSGECDGLPRITLQTAPGYCVGLAAAGLGFPRGVLPLADGSVLVANMGGWQENAGSIWRLTRNGNTYAKTRLLEKLDRPHGLAIGPDGLVYAGLVGRVIRFQPEQARATLHDVIGGASGVNALPGTGRHPLTSFVFDKDRNLLVNVGSATDNCEAEGSALPDPHLPCPETQGADARGAIRKYVMAWPEGRVVSWSNYASGLRNSVALAVHAQSGTVMQAENSRDAIQVRMPALKDDEELPHDELNVIEAGAQYGWPQCYDNGVASPEFPDTDCSKFRKPLRLLPAHAAPLGMIYAAPDAASGKLAGALVIAYHGYRKHGHRIVAFPADARGMPSADSFDVVLGWDKRATQPMGAPVDIKQAADGAFYITEDRNGTLLRLIQLRK